MSYEFLSSIDFFGKSPELYIKGRPKQVTIIGRIFTLIFITIYILIFCYKVYRMSIRVDITFYDSYSNTDEKPTIKITKENFTLVFAVFDEYGEPFIEESIYYPLAFFYDGDFTQINIERCDPDKIGHQYQQYFANTDISNFYCITDINYEMVPYKNSIRIEIFPCKDNNENETYCESNEVIEEYLNNLLFIVYFQDIMLTPLNYSTPVKKRINNLNTEIFNNLGQYLHTEMETVRIETSTNIIGFDFFTKPKVEQFIKFDKEQIIPYPGFNLQDENNNYPISIFEVLLNDKILLEKRNYIQLIDVLGEIGGLMEIIYSFFGMICSLIVDTLYEKNIINNLFSFDLSKKLILIKKKKNEEIIINKEKNNKKNNINNLLIFKKKNTDIEINDKKSEKENNTMKNSFKDMNKNSEENILNVPKKIKIEKNNEKLIVENITLKNIFIALFYCFKIKRKNIYNVLLNESLNLVMEKLDIFNIFRNMCSTEFSNDEIYNNIDIIKMSKKCSNDLDAIIK